MAFYVKISFISIFSLLFLVFTHDFIKSALISPVLQLQAELVMTSQIRSHMEYLAQTYYILVLIL